MQSEDRIPGRCNAVTRDGAPCRKYPVGGAGEGRCRFHGGTSTGPGDTSHLEGNDYAEGNAGGGAPEGNANAEIHGGFSDWRKAYDRLDDETREWVDRLAKDMQERAAEHAPDVDPERRARLAREKATLMHLERRASADVWTGEDGPGRGFVIESEVQIDGETYTATKANPAIRAELSLSKRTREIADELRLWPGFRTED